MSPYTEGISSRRAALDTLVSFSQGEPLKKSLRKNRSDLTPVDQGLCLEIVEGVLRRRPMLDHLLTPFLNKPLAALDGNVRTALQVGLYQLVYLDRVPAYAAVDATVAATRGRGPKSVVNGVLRTILRKYPEPEDLGALPEQAIEAAKYPLTKATLSGGIPQWLAERWLNHVPKDRLEQCLISQTARPVLTLRATVPTQAEPVLEELLEAGLEATLHPFLEGSLVVDSPQVFHSDAFVRGDLFVQDASSSLASVLVTQEQPKNILDLCTAPGGKLMAMAGLCPDAQFVAADSSAQRLDKTRENLQRTGFMDRAELITSEGTKELPEGLFDLVFVDAPCTAWGTLRKNPDSRWRSQSTDPSRLAKTTLDLILEASERVASNGLLAYFVCSFEPEETTQVAESFSAEGFSLFNPDIPTSCQEFLEPAQPGLMLYPTLEAEMGGGYLCLWRKQ